MGTKQIMPEIKIVRKARHTRRCVWLICPSCHEGRWVRLDQVASSTFTGLCKHCHGVRQGEANVGLLARDRNPLWKGGRFKTLRGYILVLCPDHPRANSHGYVLEHILVWETVHNKSLPQGWVIHHLNGVTFDNRPKNLIGLPNKKHQLVLSEKAARIRELEAEVKLLERALEDNQLVFRISEN